jgi:NitT/TauT family transport system permease protein
MGCALGITMGRWRRLDLLLDNLVTALLNLPALVVIVPIYVVRLNEVGHHGGRVEQATIHRGHVAEGARALDPALEEMAVSFRPSRWRVLRHDPAAAGVFSPLPELASR